MTKRSATELAGGRVVITLKSNLIRIGTRRSKLALWQANHVSSLLAKADPSLKISLVPIETSGDRLPLEQFAPLIPSPLMGDVVVSPSNQGQGEGGGIKGLFVKEIESALIGKKIDLAVHSMKDLPMDLPKGLVIAAIPPREDPRDVLLSRDAIPFEKLPAGASVGTASLRRVNQLKQRRADLAYVELRGNVDTRVKRLKEGKCDAIVLAAAGLNRLGMKEEITEFLDIIPAAGQGAIGIEIRNEDGELEKILNRLDDRATHLAVDAEREFLSIMQGGCRLPVACHVKKQGASFSVEAFVSNIEGSRFLADRLTISRLEEASDGARKVAQKLLSAGARRIVDSIR